MGTQEALTSGLVLALGATALTLAAWRVAGALVGRDALDRCLVALTLGLGALCAVLQVLGIAGLLRRWPVTLVLIALAAGALLRVPPLPAAGAVPGGRRPSPKAVAAFAIGGAVAGLALVLGLQGASQSVDTVQYHAVNAGTWLHAHSLLTLPVALPGYSTNSYPSNHTLSALWLMLATGGDQVAYAVNVAWGALAVLGGASLARALGGRPAAGALLTLGVVLAPVSFATQANSLLNDLAISAGIVVAAGAVLRAADSERPWPWALVAGVALGLAMGSKYTAFIPGAAVALVPVLLRGRAGVRVSAVVTAAATPLVVFWLVRNAVEFGNPLFPLAIGPLDGLSSPLLRFDTPIVSHLLHTEGPLIGRWLDLGREVVGPALLLPVVALAAGALALRRRDRPTALVAGVALVSVGAYLLTPFTGGGPDGVAFLISSNYRYALPALLVAAPVVAVMAGRWSWLVAAPLLVFGIVKVLEGLGVRADLDVTPARGLAAVAAGAVVTTLAMRPPPLGRLGRALVPTAALLVLAGTAAALVGQTAQPPTATERLLAERGCPDGRVGVIWAAGLRSLMGREFDTTVVAVDQPAPAGRTPILEPRGLDRRIRRLGLALLVEAPGETQPRGWRGPPGWQPVGRLGRSRILAPPKDEACPASFEGRAQIP